MGLKLPQNLTLYESNRKFTSMQKKNSLKLFIISILLLVSYVTKAQNFQIEGTIMDSLAKRTLPYATVSLVRSKD